MENKIHFIVLAILSIVFLGLLFLSVSKNGVEENYQLDSSSKYVLNSYEVMLGKVNIKNTGFLSKKIVLNKYVLCSFSQSSPQFFSVEYKGNYEPTYTSSPFETFSQNYVELSRNQEIQLTISGRIDKYALLSYPENIVYPTEKQIYLYKIEPTENEWNYCNSASQEKALKVITLTIINTTQTPQAQKVPYY